MLMLFSAAGVFLLMVFSAAGGWCWFGVFFAGVVGLVVLWCCCFLLEVFMTVVVFGWCWDGVFVVCRNILVVSSWCLGVYVLVVFCSSSCILLLSLCFHAFVFPLLRFLLLPSSSSSPHGC